MSGFSQALGCISPRRRATFIGTLAAPRRLLHLQRAPGHPSRIPRGLRRHWQLYLLLLPALVYFSVFHYYPLLGAQIAFKNYSVNEGI